MVTVVTVATFFHFGGGAAIAAPGATKLLPFGHHAYQSK